MQDNEIIGTGWRPTTEVLSSADDVIALALEEAGVKRDDLDAVGTTGYGRFLIGERINADLIQEELTVNSKGAVFLADHQHGPSTVIDIGGWITRPYLFLTVFLAPLPWEEYVQGHQDAFLR